MVKIFLDAYWRVFVIPAGAVSIAIGM